jgi:hypothetical protein
MNCKCGRDMMKIRLSGMYWCLNCGRLLDISNLEFSGEFWHDPIIATNQDLINKRMNKLCGELYGK